MWTYIKNLCNNKFIINTGVSLEIMTNIISIILNPIITYYCSGFNLFVCLLSVDSIYHAINFIANNANKNMSESQIMRSNNYVYKVGSLERYSYYAICYICLLFASFFIFNSDLSFINYAICFTLYPHFFNNVICSRFKGMFKKITEAKNNGIKKIIFNQIDKAMKLQHKNEMYEAFNHVDITMFVKNVIATIVIIELRKTSKIYYKIAKYISTYLFGESIKNVTLEDAQKIYDEAVMGKQYDKMTKLMFIQSFIFIHMNNDAGSLMKKINRIKYKLLVMCSLWTVGSFFSNYIRVLIIVTTSLALSFSRNEIIKKESIGSSVLTIICGFASSNAFGLSFANQFAYELLREIFNDIMKTVGYNYVNFKDFSIVVGNWLIATVDKKYIGLTITYIIMSKTSQFAIFIIPLLLHKYIADMKMFIVMYLSIINNRDQLIKLLLFSVSISLIDVTFKTIREIKNKKNNKQIEISYTCPTIDFE